MELMQMEKELLGSFSTFLCNLGHYSIVGEHDGVLISF